MKFIQTVSGQELFSLTCWILWFALILKRMSVCEKIKSSDLSPYFFQLFIGQNFGFRWSGE